ncbi:MAG: LPXTG cell wall anchor domain-containing protein, partial [Nocardioides sp.]
GNDTMTDRVEFGLRWTATAETGETEAEILGVEAFAPGVGGAGGVPLPFTGVTVQPWLIWFGGVLVSGGALLLGSRRVARVPAY